MGKRNKKTLSLLFIYFILGLFGKKNILQIVNKDKEI